MKVIEFRKKYPNYDLGFMASNPLTETEKVIGLRMQLVCDTNTNKEYQEFCLYDKYDALKNEIKDMKTHSFEMSVNNNNVFNVLIKLDKDTIKGICLETKERIIFSKEKIHLIIPKIDESHSSDWFDYLDEY